MLAIRHRAQIYAGDLVIPEGRRFARFRFMIGAWRRAGYCLNGYRICAPKVDGKLRSAIPYRAGSSLLGI